jgi:crotonobetainyl-CoA:carnitine CoA-transferase CaiB-like acyl-CoA transferase
MPETMEVTSEPSAALAGVRVVDLTQYKAGPYCTKLMAGFGAEVIKVEPPGLGDGMRRMGPFHEEREGVETSIPFQWLNTGKKSITLDLKKERGRAILLALAREADVVVESFMPRVMSDLGLGYEDLREVNPAIVMTSISNFGQDGPYRDYEADEITEYALGGSMYLTGDPKREPLASGPEISQYTSGMWAYIMTMAELFQRDGVGRHIDVSILESVVDNIEIALIEHLHEGKLPCRKNDKHTMVPWELYPCADGEVAVIGGPYRHWLPAAEMFQEPRLFDAQFREAMGRIEHRDEFEPLLQPWLRLHRKEEVFHEGQARGLAFGYLADLDEALANPQHEARRFFVDVEHPVVGAHRHCGAPFKLSETEWRSRRSPLLGEHTESVLTQRLDYHPSDVARLKSEGVI